MAKIVDSGLAPKGYTHRRVEDENYFTRRWENLFVEHTFHLSGEHLFYCFSNTYVVYTELAVEIARLVPERSEEVDRYGLFGPSTSAIVYWPSSVRKQLTGEDEVASVADGFLAAVDAVEEDFVRKYLDPEIAVAESRLFYTKWPNNMGPMKTALLLISWGLRTRQSELVAEAAERIEKKISYCRVERERDFMLAVRVAALEASLLFRA